MKLSKSNVALFPLISLHNNTDNNNNINDNNNNNNNNNNNKNNNIHRPANANICERG